MHFIQASKKALSQLEMHAHGIGSTLVAISSRHDDDDISLSAEIEDF